MDEYYISDLDSLFIISNKLMSLTQGSKVLSFPSSPEVFNNKCLASCLSSQIRRISKSGHQVHLAPLYSAAM